MVYKTCYSIAWSSRLYNGINYREKKTVCTADNENGSLAVFCRNLWTIIAPIKRALHSSSNSRSVTVFTHSGLHRIIDCGRSFTHRWLLFTLFQQAKQKPITNHPKPDQFSSVQFAKINVVLSAKHFRTRSSYARA